MSTPFVSSRIRTEVWISVFEELCLGGDREANPIVNKEVAEGVLEEKSPRQAKTGSIAWMDLGTQSEDDVYRGKAWSSLDISKAPNRMLFVCLFKRPWPRHLMNWDTPLNRKVA